MKKVNISHVNNLHNDWLRAIDFYDGELNILKSRLTEIGGKNTGKEVMKQVEHFENQLKIQADNLDNLKHIINQNATAIGMQAEEGHYIDGILLNRHNELEQAFHQEEATISSLRHDFNRFAAEWM